MGVIVKHIVAIANRRETLNDLPCIRIEYEQSCREPSHDEQAVAGFVQGHRIVRERHSGPPRPDDRVLFPVNHCDLARFGKIHIRSGSVLFKLKGLGVERRAFRRNPDRKAVTGKLAIENSTMADESLSSEVDDKAQQTRNRNDNRLGNLPFQQNEKSRQSNSGGPIIAD